MEKEKMDRLNELARKSKETPLSAEELAEQKALREEYLQGFRANFRSILDNTYIQEEDGTKRKLKKKEADKNLH